MTPLSYQLYSSRNFTPLGDTLKMLAEIGYKQVEGYSALYADASALAVLQTGLAATGLTMPTGHFSLDMARDQVDRVKLIAETLGITTIFVPHVTADQRPGSTAGWSDFGGELARIAEAYWAEGLAFGWHNHDFELIPTAQGDLPLDLILAADPRLALELDVAWVVRGGADPLEMLKRHSGQILSAHIKDIADNGENLREDGWADVGHGVMDWPGLMAALRATKCAYYVMEHDNPSDHKRFAQRSFTAASAY